MRAVRGRWSHEEFRVLIGRALLDLGDIPRLADSPLVELPEVRRRAAGSTMIFGEGVALDAYLREQVSGVIARLHGTGKVAILRSILEGVCAGKSIAQIAREHGRTRSFFSRHYWAAATRVVAQEVA